MEESAKSALVDVGRSLRRNGYRFTTVTPETHARVLRRANGHSVPRARDARDVFGWGRPFEPALLEPVLFRALQRADAVVTEGDLLRSRVRFSSLGDHLLVHSAFPTLAADAVFFGPDTYRFCALLERWAPRRIARLLDLGCGTGAGGISLSKRADELVLVDLNAHALDAADVNVRLNGARAALVQSDLLANVGGDFDCVIANPPYMRDAGGRVYRDGGGEHGEALSVRIVREGLTRLRPGGTLIVYTGTAIVRGADSFWNAVEPELSGVARSDREYVELDPDVFGDELDQPGYEDVERIAAVGLCVHRR